MGLEESGRNGWLRLARVCNIAPSTTSTSRGCYFDYRRVSLKLLATRKLFGEL